MAKVSYLDGNTEQFGYTFDGKPVDVSDERHLAKFRGNRFFKVSETKEKAAEGSERPEGHRAIHKGHGKFSVVFGDKDEEVVTDLNKDDADTFNAMSEEDKAQYVKAK